MRKAADLRIQVCATKSCHSSLATALWDGESRSRVTHTFAFQKVCGLSRPEGAVSSDSQALIAFFGMRKAADLGKQVCATSSPLFFAMVAATVLWDEEKGLVHWKNQKGGVKPPHSRAAPPANVQTPGCRPEKRHYFGRSV